MNISPEKFIFSQELMRQQLSYQWLRVAFLCTSYLPARLLSLPYLAHVL